MNTTIEIEGMSCQHCVMRVRKALEATTGVTALDVVVGKADVTFDDSTVSREALVQAITKAGYKVKD